MSQGHNDATCSTHAVANCWRELLFLMHGIRIKQDVLQSKVLEMMERQIDSPTIKLQESGCTIEQIKTALASGEINMQVKHNDLSYGIIVRQRKIPGGFMVQSQNKVRDLHEFLQVCNTACAILLVSLSDGRTNFAHFVAASGSEADEEKAISEQKKNPYTFQTIDSSPIPETEIMAERVQKFLLTLPEIVYARVVDPKTSKPHIYGIQAENRLDQNAIYYDNISEAETFIPILKVSNIFKAKSKRIMALLSREAAAQVNMCYLSCLLILDLFISARFQVVTPLDTPQQPRSLGPTPETVEFLRSLGMDVKGADEDGKTPASTVDGSGQKSVKDEAGQIGGVGVVIQETKNKDMEIIQIVPGGPAHLSGVVRIGDIVESVDGLFVSGPSKFLQKYFSSEITLKLRAEQGLSFLMSCVSFWEKAALTSPSVLFGMEQL
jgi:hypothetical protein